MHQLFSKLPETSTLLADQQDSWVLVYSLWIGFGILTILSMVLVWTRWGQAKPLSKCIALSIFAHILLGGYAYGTRLMFNYSNSQKQDAPVAFSVIEDVDVEEENPDKDQEDHSENQNEVEKPWEKFADSQNNSPQAINTTKLVNHQAVVPERQDNNKPIEYQNHEIQQVVGNAPKEPAAPNLRENEFDIQKKIDESNVNPAKIAEVKSPERRDDLPSENSPDTSVPASQVAEKMADASQSQKATPQAEIRPASVSSSHLKEELENQVVRRNAQFVPGPKEIKDANSVPEPASPNTFRNVSRNNQNSSFSPSAQTTKKRRRLADGQPIPEIYQNRFVENRSLLIQRNGGLPKSQEAVEQALKWLSSEQSEDGRWNPRRFNAGNETNVYGHNRGGAGFHADTGITGLVLLSFLGAGHTHLEGPYQKTVQKGLEYLIRNQNQDGSMYGEAGLFARTYCHGMALMAIAEAYSLTGDHRIKPFIIKGQGFTVKTQNQTTGGWRYRPGDDGDMSQFGWQVMALKSCELAGVKIPAKTKQLMIRFLKRYAKGRRGGLAAYRPAEKPSRTMTAESLFCQRLLNLNVPATASQEAVDFIMEELPGDDIDNLYYWYYATLSIHKEQSEFDFQKTKWQQWNRKLTQRILALQQKKGGPAGSFSDKTLWSSYGGRFYSTAISALCLEAQYRYKSENVKNRTARR